MDISIDQGGCVETSRPTTHQDPTFIEENVIHYCVPNMSSGVARTASLALTYAVLPYLLRVARDGIVRSVHSDAALACGVVLAQGEATSRAVARAFSLPYQPVEAIFAREGTGEAGAR